MFHGKEFPLHQRGLPVEAQFADASLPLGHPVSRGFDGGMHQIEAHVQEEGIVAPTADQVDCLVRQYFRQVLAG